MAGGGCARSVIGPRKLGTLAKRPRAEITDAAMGGRCVMLNKGPPSWRP